MLVFVILYARLGMLGVFMLDRIWRAINMQIERLFILFFFFYFLFTEMCILNDLSKFLFCHLINKSKFNFTAEKFIKLCTTYNGYIPIPIPIRRMCVWVCASEFFLSFVHETVLTTMLSILFLAHFVFIKFCTLFDSYKPKINFICK